MSAKRSGSDDPARMLKQAGVNVIGRDSDELGPYWIVQCQCGAKYSWQKGDQVNTQCRICLGGGPRDCVEIAGQIHPVPRTGTLAHLNWVTADYPASNVDNTT